MLIPLIVATVLLQPLTGVVRGTVTEARTGAPLAAVLVKIQSTGQQAFSDAEGRFEIVDVPAGPQTLTISVVGYGLVRRDVTVTAGEAVDVSIPVAEGASTYVENVAVSAGAFRDAEPGIPSQSVLGSRDLLGLRALIADDPYRAAHTLPGVAAGDDFRAEFAVRGLGPSHVGISIDGIDSPLLFHTVRAEAEDSGSLGLINSDVLESATLLSGPHPQRLNSHLGARLDFTTRDGARDRFRARALLSASAASTVWEGPLGSSQKASWLVAVRQSYLDWLLRMVDSSAGATFGYLDGQAKLTVDLTPRQTLRATIIAGRSELREAEPDPQPNELASGKLISAIGNVQWRYSRSASFAVTQQLYVINADYTNRVHAGWVRDEGGDVDATWRGGVEWNPAPAHFFEFGAQSQRLEASRIVRRQVTPVIETLVAHTGVHAWSSAAYAQYRWTPSMRFAVTPGVRVERWNLIDSAKASPWLLSEYELTPGLRARFGAGIQRQSPGLDHALQIVEGTRLVPERSATAEAGLERRIGAAWRASVSAYYRRDTDLLRFQDAEIRLENNRVIVPRRANWRNALNGDARGLELKVERRSAAGLNGWLSYAWNKSELQDAGDGTPERFAADYDQRHTMNAFLAYRWSGRTSVSARLRYGSNFPIRGYIGASAAGYVLSEQRNTLRMPEYVRLDLRADRTFTFRSRRLTLFMEVINVSNHENVRPNGAGVNLTTRRVFEPTESTFPLLPIAGILVEF